LHLNRRLTNENTHELHSRHSSRKTIFALVSSQTHSVAVASLVDVVAALGVIFCTLTSFFSSTTVLHTAFLLRFSPLHCLHLFPVWRKKKASSGRGSGVGLRTDPAWSHCIFVDGKARNLKCKYCEKVLTSGIYRLKHHLVGTSKDVGACIVISENVKK